MPMLKYTQHCSICARVQWSPWGQIDISSFVHSGEKGSQQHEAWIIVHSPQFPPTNYKTYDYLNNCRNGYVWIEKYVFGIL